MLEYGYDFVLMPEADEVMELYGVQAVPALFVVDGQGKIRFNLYYMVFNDSSEFKAMGHGKKTGRGNGTKLRVFINLSINDLTLI